VDNAPPQALPGQGPAPVAGQQPIPAQAGSGFGAGAERLTAGSVLEGGRSGRDTFARPGQQGFRAFQGQEFNPFLLRSEAGNAGAALSARDALQTGGAGRSLVGGGGETDPFLRELTGG
jgi:hypothetical protein